MPTRGRQLVELALVFIIAFALLIIGTTTYIGMVALLLVPTPFIYLARQHRLRERVIPVFLFILASLLLLGPLGAFAALFLGLLGTVMGHFYRNRNSGLPAVIAGAATVLGSFLLGLLLLTTVFGFDLAAEMNRAKEVVINEGLRFPVSSPVTDDEWKKSVEQEFDMIQMILPTYFVSSSIVFSVVVHWLSRWLLKLCKYTIPAMPPVREWKFPRSLLIYYFAAMLIMLLMGENMTGSFWERAFLNLKVLLDIVFTIQGVSFCFFAFYLKRWRILGPLLVVFLFIFPLLTYILSILGIFDLGLNFRKRLETRVKRS
ncbi:DUF2232 domain-containing protein [Brevibacillus fulvus]|uniref:Uncharacterized protein YybS (DUF2232 family) n=1 Tax=Brevibacillus fulvus TaxID=1125967 RepID=A0A938Y4H5_9BACL|nr:DUF2232 domain-containing protein [Brevibacillus fulvus]MBM7591801.1 uncharacterized protein YybS (DUF2232 family) [Brevibacillus fulvus]